MSLTDPWHCWQAGRGAAVLPTAGVQHHAWRKGGVAWTVFDMGGAGRYRELWERYFRATDGLVFVVDVTDVERIGVVREEFQKVVSRQDVDQLPILVLCNQKPVSGSGTRLSVEDVKKVLQLREAVLRRHAVHIVSVDITGAGLDEAWTWLRGQVLGTPGG